MHATRFSEFNGGSDWFPITLSGNPYPLLTTFSDNPYPLLTTLTGNR